MEKSHFIHMGVEELLHELLVNENVKLNVLDIENHIRINTNNYEIPMIELLYGVLFGFVFRNLNMKYKGKVYELRGLHRAYSNGEQLDNINFNDYSVWDNELNDGFDDEFDNEPDDESDNEPDDDRSDVFELLDYFNTARTLRHMNKGMYYEYEQGVDRIESYVTVFARVFIKHGLKIKWPIDEIFRGSKYAVKRIKRSPLTFSGLFTDEYKVPEKMKLFYSSLSSNGFIDESHVWREDTDKNEPAKVYFWLKKQKKNRVFNDNKPTPALICFCNQFGITAYKDTEPTPPADVRAVTIKNLLMAENTITTDEKKRFEDVFSPYLSK